MIPSPVLLCSICNSNVTVEIGSEQTGLDTLATE